VFVLSSIVVLVEGETLFLSRETERHNLTAVRLSPLLHASTQAAVLVASTSILTEERQD
jgi:hypothetical protein